jgi:hypothetical protein
MLQIRDQNKVICDIFAAPFELAEMCYRHAKAGEKAGAGFAATTH